jgi:hypothetical protein
MAACGTHQPDRHSDQLHLQHAADESQQPNGSQHQARSKARAHSHDLPQPHEPAHQAQPRRQQARACQTAAATDYTAQRVADEAH